MTGIRRGLIRRAFAVGAGAVVAAAVLATPASAATAPEPYYEKPTPYVGTDTFNPGCENVRFKVKTAFEGVSATLNVPASDGQAFLSQNTYFFNEKWINKKTGKWFRVIGEGQFAETAATFVPKADVPADLIPEGGLVGPVYLFEQQDIVKKFAVKKANGKLVARDRGVLYFEELFDTLGDSQPGGVSLSSEIVDVQGDFPLLDVDLCKLGARLTR